MKVTTKIEECRVPIFQVNFVSSSELHWIAVEALLISYARNINFYRLYMGMIFGRLISYNKDHAEQFIGFRPRYVGAALLRGDAP